MKRVWKRIGIGLLVAAVVTLTAFLIALKRAEPILRKRVMQTLASRFDSRVELASFHVAVLHGFEVQGGGLKLYPNGMKSSVPAFAVDSFTFHSGWFGLLRTPTHVQSVDVSGLRIHVPPKSERKQLRDEHSEQKQEKKGARIVVGEIVCRNAQLVIDTDEPGKLPKQFDIRELRLHSVGAARPMEFNAVLTIPKPVGDVQSSGHFGPYRTLDPGSSPVDGTYSFTHADLNSIKGIGGMLSSTGKYSGTLDRIAVDGTTDTPNFSVDVSGHPVHLTTQFHAIVDGLNGDTYLQPVHGEFLHTRLTAKGYVVNEPGKGHHTFLDVTLDEARIEDLLTLGVKTNPPVMRGDAQLHTLLEVPPGAVRVPEKLKLDGSFQVRQVRFTNPAVQSKVDELSLRSQGDPDKAKREAKDPNFITRTSSMQGRFRLGGGRLLLHDLQYRVPGAEILLNGVYTLDGNQFDMFGHVRLQAKLSNIVGGWKGLLLKPFDPIFQKPGAGTVIPVTISGTHASPHFGLDLHSGDKHKRMQWLWDHPYSKPH